jgi:hypothetical protein
MNSIHSYVYLLPLLLTISLVYAATRHESWRRILTHAARHFGLIVAVMGGALVLLLVINSTI